MAESSRYQISHTTNYKYSAPVAICQNQLRMMPRMIRSLTASAECNDSLIQITPEPLIQTEHRDYNGNRVVFFSIESLHSELTVSVTSDVTIIHNDFLNADSPQWEVVRNQVVAGLDKRWLEAQEFTFDSPRVFREKEYETYARESFSPNRQIIEATRDLTRRIHQDFRYDNTATDVYTTTKEAFLLKAGVCQDFAHVQLACLRSIGLPARYVSGYLRTVPVAGQPRLVGADESHAWISIYCGYQLGWLDFDPTNDCIAGINHIPICIGRDYDEVSPMRGVVVGGGETTLSVNVDVQPVDAE